MPLDDRPASSAEQDRQLKLSSSLFATRRLSLDIAEPLSAEDQVVQANEDASPTKWHLAHTTWFFEAFVLKRFLRGYSSFRRALRILLQLLLRECRRASSDDRSGASDAAPRAKRCAPIALMSTRRCGGSATASSPARQPSLIELGINHEQQHQELLLTDILALFAAEPLKPAYRRRAAGDRRRRAAPLDLVAFAGGIFEVGHERRRLRL